MTSVFYAYACHIVGFAVIYLIYFKMKQKASGLMRAVISLNKPLHFDRPRPSPEMADNLLLSLPDRGDNWSTSEKGVNNYHRNMHSDIYTIVL